MSRPIHVEESTDRCRRSLKRGGRSYVADSTVTEIGTLTYRFERSGTLGKLAGSRTVIAGASRSEAVFTNGIEITPSGVNRPLQPIIVSTARSELRGDLECLGEFSNRAESLRCLGTPREGIGAVTGSGRWRRMGEPSRSARS